MLSVCMIAKNEEKNIARCLTHLKPYGFEIVVIDTGSADRTRAIARQYTDKVYDFIWRDDFAAAKNFAVSKAENPYVMILDCDEVLEYMDVKALLRLLEDHPNQVGRIRIKNVFIGNGMEQENQEWINRIFPKKIFHYEGRIHEQITSSDGMAYDTFQAPVTIVHTGYNLTLEGRRKKAGRNIALLQKELERLQKASGAGNNKQCAEQMPYILYQIGKSCYMSEDYTAACHYFSEGLSYDVNPKLEYVIDMVETYGYALLNCGRAEAALFFENIYDEFGNSADFQFLMGLVYMNNGRFEQAVKEFLHAAEHRECRIKGVNSYAAYYNIGVIYECLGEIGKAKKYYAKSGDYAPALKRLKRLPEL